MKAAGGSELKVQAPDLLCNIQACDFQPIANVTEPQSPHVHVKHNNAGVTNWGEAQDTSGREGCEKGSI